MQDFEKTRLDYVQRLETQVAHQQRIIAELQAEVAWIPKLATKMENGAGYIVMALRGKNQTIEIPLDVVAAWSNTDLTTAVLTEFCKDLIDRAYRPIIAEQLEPITKAAQQNLAKSPLMGKA